MSNTLIKTQNLSRIFLQGDSEIKAVDNVNIEVSDGDFVAISGKSGSGKTTLLNLIGGIDKPSAGKVFIDGADLYALSDAERAKIRRQKMGYVFQNFSLLPILTAKENILLPLMLDNKKLDKEYFDEIISRLKIKDRLNHFPNQLSGGQQQRVAIARALINKPSLLLADEPTGNLDKKSAEDIMRLIVDINLLKISVILVTHDEGFANLSKRRLVISDGQIADV